jgi:protein-disulfide isomerase
MGTPGAPVVMVIFSDFQCSYCQKEAQSIRADLLKTFPAQVRVYFKDMPIPQIHPWAMTAAVAGRCVFRQKATAFWDYHDFMFGKQNEITVENIKGKIEEFAKSKNLDVDQLNACAASKSASAEVEKSIGEGKLLGVASTPTLFINGRRIPGYVPFENLKQIVEFEIGYQAVNKNAGEQCCTLPVPGLLNPSANPVLPK